MPLCERVSLIFGANFARVRDKTRCIRAQKQTSFRKELLPSFFSRSCRANAVTAAANSLTADCKNQTSSASNGPPIYGRLPRDSDRWLVESKFSLYRSFIRPRYNEDPGKEKCISYKRYFFKSGFGLLLCSVGTEKHFAEARSRIR